MMAADAKGIVETVVTAAKNGDLRACRIILDRLAPPLKDRSVEFDLPALKSPADAVKAAAALIAATARGDLTPGEASDVARLVETFVRAVEAHDLAKRLEALEERVAR